MNVNELRYAIESSFTTCAQCDSVIDSWPEADPSEPGHKLIYSSRDALFAGMCERAHVNEFYLAEVKAGELQAHDITERTLGHLVRQDECKHDDFKPVIIPVDDGKTFGTPDGPFTGPGYLKICSRCHRRWGSKKEFEQKTEAKQELRLIGLDGRPLRRRRDAN